MKKFGILAAVSLFCALSLNANAAIIFEDDFDRPNNNNTGWLELENDANDVRVRNGTL